MEFDDGLRHDGKDDPPSNLISHLGQFGDPSDMLRRKEIVAAVEASLEHLSDKHRAVIVMRELQGMSYEEMAQAMKCSKGTIMSRLFHARRNMQKLRTDRLGACVPTQALEFEELGHDPKSNRLHTVEAAGGGM